LKDKETMPSRWKPPKEQRADADAVRMEQEFRRKLRDVLEYGSEDDFVAVLKAYKPDIGKEELRALIMRFRACAREKRGLC
jgi:hypothetical protein